MEVWLRSGANEQVERVDLLNPPNETSEMVLDGLKAWLHLSNLLNRTR